MKYERTTNSLDYVIRRAFNAGECWGVTYSTWFCPTAKDTEAEIKEISKKIKKGLKNPRFWRGKVTP